MPQVGQNAVTVYGLYYKIQQLIIFAAFGVRDAITPVVSFNYGARNPDRVRQGIRWGLFYTVILMAAGCLGVELFAEPLAGLFSLSETTLPLCLDCMRIVSLGFLFAADVSRVWWPLALGEAATLVVALIMFRSVYRKKVCDLH